MKKFNLLDTTNTDILATNASWALPQVAAWFNNWNLVRNPNNKISFKKTLEQILANPDHSNFVDYNLNLVDLKNLWNWLILAPRGKVIKTPSQTSVEGVRWSGGVPIILSFFKQYRDVQYMDWDWSEPEYQWWLDRDLIKWVETAQDKTFLDWLKNVDASQLSNWLEMSLTVRRGDRSGQVRKSTTLSNVYTTGDKTFDGLPRLMKLCLTQAHCYHPTHKAAFLLYHPFSWDSPVKITQSLEVLPNPTNLTNPWNEI